MAEAPWEREERQKREQRFPGLNGGQPFVETVASREIAELIDHASKEATFAVVSGPAGVGKTTALTHYGLAAEAYIVTVRSTMRKFLPLWREILEAISDGYDYVENTGAATDRKVRNLLKAQGFGHFNGPRRHPILIIDEAGTLIDLEVLRELARLVEEAGASVILCGNDHRLKQTSVAEAALDQIASRVDWRINYGALTDEDCRKLCVRSDVEHGQIAPVVQIGRGTNIRMMAKVLKHARRLAGPTAPLGAQHIHPAITRIFPEKEAKKLLAAMPSRLSNPKPSKRNAA